ATRPWRACCGWPDRSKRRHRLTRRRRAAGLRCIFPASRLRPASRLLHPTEPPDMIRMNTLATAAAVIAAAAALSACSGMGTGRAAARADLRPTAAVQPNTATGTVRFTALDHGVRVAGEVRGLPPGTEHGFHIHEKGDCGDNGNASGGHFNPAGGTHGKFGSAGTHAGELPSLVADASGVARFR